MPRRGASYYYSDKQAYRVKVTTWERGPNSPRKRTFVVPADSDREAEAIIRRRLSSSMPNYHGGYNIQTRRLNVKYREAD